MKKRLFSFFLAALMIFTALPIAAVSSAMIGDVDGSGDISASDARLALRASVGLETLDASKRKVADVDGSGDITASDARLILRASVGLETLAPPEFDENDLLAEKPVYNPKPKPGSGSKAFKVTPQKGITISAPKDALDKDRTFNVKRLSDAENDGYLKQTEELGAVPLVSFNVDAGLKFPAMFPGEIKVDFDLKDLGIEKALWDKCTAFCIGDDGFTELLTTEYNNGTVSCKLSHNSIIGLCLVGIGGGYILGKDYMSRGIPDIDFAVADLQFNKASYGVKYRLYFPDSMPKLKSEEYIKLEQEANNIYKKYASSILKDVSENIDGVNVGQVYFQALNREAAQKRKFAEALAKDTRYQEILAKFKDTDWLVKNYAPKDVSRTIKALKYADEYLFSVCGFRAPKYRIDIFMMDGDGSAFAHADNLLTRRPFIKVYKNDKDFGNDTSVAITMVHELFHVVQMARYCMYDDRSDTGFWEATAILLEREAYKYYLSKNYVPKDDNTLTVRKNWGDFTYPVMNYSYWKDVDTDMAARLSVDQGYTASHFLEFVQDRYGRNKTASDRIKFLRDLLTDYDSIFTSDWIEALSDITSSDRYSVARDFSIFCITRQTDFVDNYKEMTGNRIVDYGLSEKNLVRNFKYDGGPLCCDVKYFQTSKMFDRYVTAFFYNDGADKDEYPDNILRIIDYDTKEPIKVIRGSGRFAMTNKNRFYVQQIHGSDKKEKEAQLTVVLLTPQKCPKIDISHDSEHKDDEKYDNVDIYFPQYKDERITTCLTLYYNGVKKSFYLKKNSEGVRLKKYKLMEYFDITKVKELEKMQLSVKQMILMDDEDPIYGPEGIKCDVISKSFDFEALAGTYKGTYVNDKGESFPATYTLKLTKVQNGFQYATFSYDFGELRSDGKYTDQEGHEHVIEHFLVDREDRAEMTDLVSFSCVFYANGTMVYERLNALSNTVTGKMTGKKVN